MKLFKKDTESKIIRSNVIQYDDLGCPLRLVILANGKQAWVDTIAKKADVVLTWYD